LPCLTRGPTLILSGYEYHTTGFSHVLVNGVPVIANGQQTNVRPGQVLLGAGAKE